MKKFISFVIGSLLICSGYAQPLTGTKTIKASGGDYSSFTAAIAALNSNGVGIGGVTFNVDAGFVDSAANLVITDSTATDSSQIIFQKAGNGNNPLIIAKAGTGNMDGIIKLTGCMYITFDKIDLIESSTNATANTRMEWGYALLKSASKKGNQFVIIKNCQISLNKANTTATYGIYQANHTTTSTTDLALSDTSFANSHNRFYSDSISNVFGGIYLRGSSTGSSSPIYDQDNLIGVPGGNYITNFSSNLTTIEGGIYGAYQNNMVIANNIINGGGTGTTATAPIYGIYTTNGTNSNIDIYNNSITLTSGATGFNASIIGISNSIGVNNGSVNTVNIYNNRIQNCKYSGTGSLAFTGITNTAAGYTVNIYENIIAYDTIGGNGNFIAISSGTGTNMFFHHNKVYSNRKTGTSGSMNCMSLNSGTVNCYNNLIHDNSIAGGTGSLYGYYNAANSSNAESVSSLKIYNLIHSGTGNVYGFYSISSVGGLKQAYNDTIYALSSAGGMVYGMYTGNGTTVRIYKNQVYNLTSTTASSIVYGIYINSGTSVYVNNNFISDLKAPAATNFSAVMGLYINGGNNVYCTYNSVFLNASSSTTTNFGSSAFYSYTTTVLDLRNNIFVNLSATGPTGGRATAFTRSSTVLTTLTSDNNCFYSGTPSSKNVIFFDGSNSDTTIASYKNRLYPKEANSFSEKPPFINSSTAPFDLHLSTSVPTSCESGGFPFTTPISITEDFDGNSRNVNFPDAGADEGNFTMLDLMQPKCSYTPLISTASTSARQITATIIDPSGVPKTGSGLPVLYWKKKLAGTWNNAQATYSGSNDQFDFSFGSGVTTGDTVFYYIAAQDSAASPNTGIYPSPGATGFSSNPPAVSKAPANPNFYVIIPGFSGGNYRIGGTGTTPVAGCSYVDLTAALADISGREITGAINLLLTKDYSASEEDTVPLIIKYVLGQDATNTITIKPDTNVVTSISRPSATSIFKFDGAKYFIIDGSNNSTDSRDLTITNTATTTNTAAVWISSQGAGKGTTDVTVTNCNISAANSTSTNFGIYFGTSSAITNSAGGADNDYISLINNRITKCYYGIFVMGTTSGSVDYLNISKNIVGSSVAGNLIGVYGIYLNSYINNSMVYQNDIFGINPTSTSPYGIYLGTGIMNTKFSKNKIHDLLSTTYGTVCGIYANAPSNTNLQFENNILYNLISIFNVYGIYLNGGSNFSFFFNSIYLSGDRDALGTNKATTPSYAIYLSNTLTNLTLKNNIFQNSQLAATNPTQAISFAIYNAGSSTIFSSINYNDYYVDGAQGILAYQGGGISSLTAWKSINTGDLNSISADPQFNSPSNLQPGIVSPVFAAGTAITGITTDINGTSRNVTNPAIGAYETGTDVTGPAISFTPFTNTSYTTARTLTATITDPSGVPTTGSGLPVLYWKKRKAGVWTPVTATSIGSNQFTFAFGSGVIDGDTVFYYIAAQDKYSTVNVSVFPAAGASGFTTNPPAVSTPPANASFYSILGSISGGNYDIGGSGTTPCGTCTYVDLTAAFNDISWKEITGAISLRLTSSYKSTEEDAFPITINPIAGASVTNTVTIKPAPGTTDTISANSTTSIIRLYGADYITIDGSNNGTSSRDLVIQNTSTSNNRAVIQISSRGVNNGATNITIKNNIIIAGIYTNSNYGISIGNNIGYPGDDNDNISVINNWFLRVNIGILAAGTTTGIQDNLTVQNNIFGDTALTNSIGKYGITISANRGFNITQNKISNINNTVSSVAGIYLSQSSGANISNNIITNIKSSGTNPTGIYVGNGVIDTKICANKLSGIKYTGTTQTGGGKGIDVASGSTLSNILIANNMVSDIMGNGNGNLLTNAIIGIRISETTKSVDIFNNSVNLSGTISRTGTSVNKNAALYLGANVADLDIRNNIFTNSILDTSASNTSYAIYSDAPASSFSNLNNNNYYVSNSQAVLGYIGGSNDSTFNAWKAASGKDGNSLNVDPVYVSNSDLHVSSVYLNSAGDTISRVTDDIDGSSRFTSHPDIGADEFDLNAEAITMGSDQILGTKATVWGKINPMNEYNVVVTFEYGTTTAYGFTATAVQSPVQGLNDISANANLTGLLQQTTYHYRVVATNSTGNTSYGKDSILKTTVGIEENKSVQSATIYMNGKNLIVECKNDLSNAQVVVYNLFGKEIYSGKMKGKQLQLDLGNAASGYYLVSITTDQTVLNRKVFVK